MSVMRHSNKVPMTFTCVSPKSCVMQNPLNQVERSDTSSECGSLCTCTSSSMTSIATIVSNNRVPDSQDNDYAALTPLVSDTQVITHIDEEGEENHYFLVKILPKIACCRTLRNLELRTSLRHYLLISTEFFLWIIGIALIYYSYHRWGLASGFSSSFFMLGIYAIFRFVRTGGVLTCTPCSSQPHTESDSSIIEDNVETDLHQRPQEIPTDTSSENPPSYDVAIIKPPPYDLKFHLSPTKLHHNPSDKTHKCLNTDQFTVLNRMSMEKSSQLKTFADNDDDTETLPSYQDVMKITIYNDGIVDEAQD